MSKSEIEWIDYQWNPLTGCIKKCSFCYCTKQVKRFSGDVRWNLKHANCMRKSEVYVLDERFITPTGATLNTPFGFAPTFHRYRLDVPATWKTTRKVLVCGEGELFGPWVPDSIITEVFDAASKYPKHHYLFITRYPERYKALADRGMLPKKENFWYGYSLPSDGNTTFVNKGFNTFVVAMPILGPIDIPKCKWLVIGTDWRKLVKIEPKEEWINAAIEKARKNKCRIFMNSDLKKYLNGKKDLIQEYPEEMLKVEHGDEARRRDVCAECGKEDTKANMITLLARSARGESAVNVCFFCKKCFEKFCGERNIDATNLKLRAYKNEISEQ